MKLREVLAQASRARNLHKHNSLRESLAHIYFAQALVRVVCAKCSRKHVRELVAQVHITVNVL